MLSGFIPDDERIVTIEDAAELQLQQPHVVRLETRPPNIEGKGEVTQRALVRNALRMRPDRIILGEVRGAEALDMLQAMNTGHEGSMTTIHANTPRDALARLENMVSMAGRQPAAEGHAPADQLGRRRGGAGRAPDRRHAQGAVDLRKSPAWKATSSRCRKSSRFEQTGVDDDGSVLGHFCATGVRPRFRAPAHVRRRRCPTRCSIRPVSITEAAMDYPLLPVRRR